MSNQPPLNPDALEAAAEAIATRNGFGCAQFSHKGDAHAAVRAYLSSLPVAPLELTNAEWQAFQAIPDQGYSHRAWVDARIAERVAVAQPEVNSVEELDALPEGTVLLVTDKRPGVGKSSWELFSDVLELRSSDGELEPKAWASPAYTTEYTCKSLWEIADQINVLYRPEVKP